MLALAGCAPSQTSFAAGYYAVTDELTVRNITIDTGDYTIGYSLEMRIVSPLENGSLLCALGDVSGRLARLQELPSEVAASGEWSHLEYFGNFDVPDITAGIRCHPTVAGEYSITVRNVDLYATAD